MGASMKDLLSDKITRVQREWDTPNGIVKIDLAVRHKRITTEVQMELQRISTSAYEELSELLKTSDEEEKSAKGAKVKKLASYEPKNVACLHLAYLVSDLDIVDEKNKPLKPTYENLIKLPTELITAIKEEIDESVLPKKKQSTTSLNGTQREENSELPLVG